MAAIPKKRTLDAFFSSTTKKARISNTSPEPDNGNNESSGETVSVDE